MATILERLELRTGETNTDLLNDIIETAKNAILSRRYPYGDYPTIDVPVYDSEGVPVLDEDDEPVTEPQTYVEDRYLDLQFRIAMDLYNKIGAEGETVHNENGINRTFESSWVSAQLLLEVVPKYIGMRRSDEMSETQ